MLRLSPDTLFHLCLFLDPQDIESLLLVCKFFNATLTTHKNTNPLWRAKFYRYFPDRFSQLQNDQPDNWHRAFVREYKERNRGMSLRTKWLVLWVKQGNIDALRDGGEVIVKNKKIKIDPLTFDELSSIKFDGDTLTSYIVLQKNQALMDYAYSLVLSSHRDILAADVNATLSKGTLRLIHAACIFNQSKDTILALKESGADIEIESGNKMRPLHSAAYDGHVLVVKQLLELGANIHAGNKNNCTALHLAARRGHLPVVELLLENDANVNAVPLNGDTPLMQAASYGHCSVVKVLLAKNANVHAARHDDNTTSLYLAAQEGHLSVVNALLEADAKVDVVIGNKNTALTIAAYKGHLSIVDALLAHEANANHIGNNDETALEKALIMKHYDIALTLYAKEVNQREDNHHIYSITFFGKTIEFGKPAKEKKDAVQALIAVKENGYDLETLIAHLPALQNGRLGKIFKGLGYQKLVEAAMKAKHSFRK